MSKKRYIHRGVTGKNPRPKPTVTEWHDVTIRVGDRIHCKGSRALDPEVLDECRNPRSAALYYCTEPVAFSFEDAITLFDDGLNAIFVVDRRDMRIAAVTSIREAEDFYQQRRPR